MAKNKRKILVLTSSYPRWENDVSGNFIFELVRRLKSDFDIYILAPAFKNSPLHEEKEGINIYRYKQFPIKNIELTSEGEILAKIKKNKFYYLVVPFFLIYQFFAMARIIRKEDIKVIHAHWIIPQALIAVIYKVLINDKIKILATIHGADINSFNSALGLKIKKKIFKHIDCLTVVSNALKNKVQDLGYQREIFVYPMGIDTILFSKMETDRYSKEIIKKSEFIILFVGGISERKGIRLLIDAMPAIIKEMSEVKLKIIGEGILKNEMQKKVQKLNLNSNVLFLGEIPNKKLPEYYNLSDLFILPSHSEGFGLVLAEAMSCKCLVLTSDLQPIRDIVNHGINGFIMESLTPENISKSVLMILSLSNEEKNKIKKAAREKIVTEFDWKIITNNYKNILTNII